MPERHVYTVGGQVQGVGFRPFIYREAARLGLKGSVRNTPEGVRIEVQGEAGALAAFASFPDRLPPLARIASLARSTMAPVEGEEGFRILASTGNEHRGHAVLVSPDIAPCAKCLADMADPQGRRFGYAFTNCTDCGPRYTITRTIPYDRPVTSMACFPMCQECSREYHSPLSRRFHAQPNACPECGPVLWLEGEGSLPQDAPPRMQLIPRMKKYPALRIRAQGSAAILQLLRALKQGKIAAIKGLGGFHLVCDARNAGAIARLRERKKRPHKALAVMVRDLEAAEKAAHTGGEGSSTRQWLCSPQRPIVICPRRAGFLPDILAPDTDSIGLMLPSTPLHHLLFHPEWCGGTPEDALDALVMTSGNVHGSPLCTGNREAKEKLSGIADLFLFHDRDIFVRADDSVLYPAGGNALPSLIVRRARGFVPEAWHFPQEWAARGSVFAAGAELKHAFCLTRGGDAFLSQHIGDLGNAGCLDFFEETLRHLLRLLEVEPSLVVRDAHPDYLSGRLAERFAAERGLPVVSLQHHAAHACAVMAEHGLRGPALALILDGSGWGPDGTVWGGELLCMRPGGWKRLGRLSLARLPGGEAAIRAPWRVAEGLWECCGLPEGEQPWAQERALPMLREMLLRDVNCPRTSSCGRLFDAVSALGGLCFAITYEGQAAIRLESAQDFAEAGAYRLPLAKKGGLWEADAAEMFRQAAADRNNAGIMARRFHRGLALGLARMARHAADETGIDGIVLAGGAFNNRTLLRELPEELKKLGLRPCLPSRFPAGDGAIALGQAYWACMADDPAGEAQGSNQDNSGTP